MTVLQAAVVNESLEFIAAQTTITDLGDGTPAGNAAQIIYAPTVNLVLRLLDPAFSRRTTSLLAAGSTIIPWLYQYPYPVDCVRARQLRSQVADPLDPPPVRWQVAFIPPDTKIVLGNLPMASLVYTSSLAPEDLWDSIFRQAVVERLAVPLSMAIAGRPDFARGLMEEAAQVAAMAEGREDA
jgi:hypothetical protein